MYVEYDILTFLITFSGESNSLANRNLPVSFWDSNYVPPVLTATHSQVTNDVKKIF